MEVTTGPVQQLQVQQLQAQIQAVDEAISRASFDWRALVGNAETVKERAAEVAELRSRRDLLLQALAAAEREAAAVGQVEQREDFLRRAEVIRARLDPLTVERVEMGRQLAKAVDDVASLIERLTEQERALVVAFDREAEALSGLGGGTVRQVLEGDSLFDLISQVLARRLGRLWPEEVAPASFGVRIEDRIERSVRTVLRLFESEIQRRSDQVGKDPVC